MSEKIEEFSQGPGMQPAALPCPNGQLYTVKPGDTLYFIAKNNNISLQSLIDANPQIADPNMIFPGQVICVPVTPGVSCPGGQIYRVVRGDTMYEIAQRYGLTLNALIRANPQIADPNLIYPGQEICIPVAPGPVNCPNGTLYTVRSGDTLYEIARRNNIPLTTLVAANPQIADPNLIFPGQTICVPTAAVLPLPEAPPTPLPEPVPPIARPIPMPPTPVPMPCPTPGVTPMPLPTPMPCPAPGREMMPMCPMPFYIQIPWEECPYRERRKCKKRRHRHEKCR